MGGMTAQEIPVRHPARVRPLQLHGTLARPDAYMHALSDVWRELRPSVGGEEWLRSLALWLFAPVTYAERPELVELLLQNALANPYPQSLPGFRHQGEAVRAHDTLQRLGDIRCPTLVTVAEHDILVPPRFSRAIAQRVPGAELKTIADPAHASMWWKPEPFNATL